MSKKTPKSTLQTPLKAYRYVRVSTEEQTKEGISLKTKIRLFAQTFLHMPQP
jgi:hypothetical protein